MLGFAFSLLRLQTPPVRVYQVHTRQSLDAHVVRSCLICTDMPKILRDEIKVNIIQSRDHILNTYAEKISEYAEVSFRDLCSLGASDKCR